MKLKNGTLTHSSERKRFCDQLSSVITDLVTIEFLQEDPKEFSRTLRHIDDMLNGCIRLAKPDNKWQERLVIPDPDMANALQKLIKARRLAEQFDDEELGLTQDVSQQVKLHLDWSIGCLNGLIEEKTKQQKP